MGEARVCSSRAESCQEMGELGAVTAVSDELIRGLLLDLVDV